MFFQQKEMHVSEMLRNSTNTTPKPTTNETKDPAKVGDCHN
jgi:hypothetical protein